MKQIKVLLILILITATVAQAQRFPSTDSIRRYTDQYVRTSAVTAFTNLRLNTVLKGLANWIDTVQGQITGGVRKVDTLYRLNDSTIRYTINGTARNLTVQGTGGGTGAVSSVFGRIGDVVSLQGDYSTAQVTEAPGYLYWTVARGRAALVAGYGWLYNTSSGIGTVDTATLSTKYLRITDSTSFYRDQSLKGLGSFSSPLSTGALHIVTDANYTVATDDLTIIFTTQSATRTLTLPAAGSNTNRVIHIKASSTNTVSLSIAVKTLGGTTFTTVNTSGEISIQSDGTDWWAFRKSF